MHVETGQHYGVSDVNTIYAYWDDARGTTVLFM